MRIRAKDVVLVMRGNAQGQEGRVLSVDQAAGKLIVEGVNRVYKHVRRSQRNPQGGRLSKEMPISLSNVMLVCPLCRTPTRVGARKNAGGDKERYCKKCNKSIGVLMPARVKQKS